jgi:spermidine synthase
MIAFFFFFFLSGFCALVYQVVWLRVAMADFGVTTPLVSIVLSVFMAGLALGSWAGGRLVRRFPKGSEGFPMGFYGACELAIGISGLTVAPLLRFGRSLFTVNAGHAPWGSLEYYLASAAWVSLVMLPFCTCMGATFPLAMAGIRAAFRTQSPRSFSYLYLANVLGAMVGTLGTAYVLIELIGLSSTLRIAAGLNFLVALLAFTVARFGFGGMDSSSPVQQSGITEQLEEDTSFNPIDSANGMALPLLFTSGLSTLGMEVVWTRQFVPFLGPLVYSFATILAVYLAATAAGSLLYRGWKNRSGDIAARSTRWIAIVLAGLFSLLPLVAADPRVRGLSNNLVRVVFGVGPLCCVLGFLTPMLVDRWSMGDPTRAARAYVVNAIGCIIGPLVSGFLLLPLVGERATLILLALPFFAFAMMPRQRGVGRRPSRLHLGLGAAAILLGLIAIILTRDYDTFFPGAQVRRDYTATVIASGTGMDKRLLINGVGITNLTPITKMMAHLPMASLQSRPQRILILCFGMGTSFRAALSWGVPATVVELTPSVPLLFNYFHRDGDELLRSPRATVVIDDARRFLERTQDMFDVIVIDPPPPVEAAATSLLYSREFYEVAARRLQPGGILQQWLPAAEPIVGSAMAKALDQSFPNIRVFRSIEGWGFHFLASMALIPQATGGELAARIPPAAARDLLEWGPALTVSAEFQTVLDREISLQDLIMRYPQAPMLTDDRPINEYFFLRQRWGKRRIPGD